MAVVDVDGKEITLPDDVVKAGVPAEAGLLAGFRPSYWSPENQSLCQLPDTYAEL